MDKTRNIIKANEGKYNEFSEYLKIVEIIEKHISLMPDVAIENCKSLIEGISRKILDKLGQYYRDGGRRPESASSLARKVLNQLLPKSEFDAVVVQTSDTLITRISEIRNERGDISHGRSYPKTNYSDSNLAELIVNTTDSYIFYVLNIFFNKDWSYLDEINYIDNVDFNDMMDTENTLPGISYSKALFDQDIISYKEQLKDYMSQNSEENSNE